MSRVLHYEGGDTRRPHLRRHCRRGRAAGRRPAPGSASGRDDVVATLCWNTPAHLAAYFAVPGMGAVLHTLNLRLSDEQLVYIINHAGDSVVIVDADLVPQLGRMLSSMPSGPGRA